MKYKIAALLAVLVVVTSSVLYALSLYRRTKVLEENQRTLQVDTVFMYKVDSLNAAKVGVLNLTISELKKYREQDAKLIKSLKADKLRNYSTTQTKTEYIVKTVLKDSIIYRPDSSIQMKTINFANRWVSVNGKIVGDSTTLNIISRDELIVTQSYIRKKFLFFKLPVKIFGYRSKQLDVVSKNPHTRISSIEYIEVCD